MSGNKPDPTCCPLCGRENACGMAQGAASCWCFETPISSEVLARLPPEARELACVCRACATGEDGAPKGVEELHALFRNR